MKQCTPDKAKRRPGMKQPSPVKKTPKIVGKSPYRKQGK